jgi:hypothetical protein
MTGHGVASYYLILIGQPFGTRCLSSRNRSVRCKSIVWRTDPSLLIAVTVARAWSLTTTGT